MKNFLLEKSFHALDIFAVFLFSSYLAFQGKEWSSGVIIAFFLYTSYWIFFRPTLEEEELTPKE